MAIHSLAIHQAAAVTVVILVRHLKSVVTAHFRLAVAAEVMDAFTFAPLGKSVRWVQGP
jgi:hypothetical protein